MALLLLAALLYWLLVTTEGVFLGQRMVVWLYDITAHRYDNIKQFDADTERFFVIEPLRQHLANGVSPLLLDVATGTGRLPLFLLETPTFHGRVIALDASAGMLARAAEKLRPFPYRAALVRQSAELLPFPDSAFDGVTCLEALEFLPDATVALREMIRVLRPGGTLLVTRRRGREARAFLHRYQSRQQFEATLSWLGMVELRSLAWQIDYDLVFARKPAAVDSP